MTKQLNTKQKLTLEYPIRVSPSLLYEYLTENFRLQEWFADKVDISEGGKLYIFHWHSSGEVQQAKILDKKVGEFIRFKFVDTEGDDSYLELKIITTELSQQTILMVEDFVEPDSADSQEELWDHQINALKHILGN